VTGYRTIVADPPWPMPGGGRRRDTRPGRTIRHRPSTLPYPTMTLDQIASLPVEPLAHSDAHLYLWTVNAHLERTYQIARGWGFQPSQIVTWCKPPSPLGGTFGSASEFFLFCRRGSLDANGKEPTNWFAWPKGAHSAKPDAFYDLVERVSPSPRVELFARRARFGWDYWGDESLGTAEMTA
jgi:N6-adenosine-specific RNA methylase IME4